MRPKKDPSECRNIPFHLRLTKDERRQFNAQARIHRMELGAYFRFLAVEDGERLAKDGKIRCVSDGEWEVLLMGKWRKIELKQQNGNL